MQFPHTVNSIHTVSDSLVYLPPKWWATGEHVFSKCAHMERRFLISGLYMNVSKPPCLPRFPQLFSSSFHLGHLEMCRDL